MGACDAILASGACNVVSSSGESIHLEQWERWMLNSCDSHLVQNNTPRYCVVTYKPWCTCMQQSNVFNAHATKGKQLHVGWGLMDLYFIDQEYVLARQFHPHWAVKVARHLEWVDLASCISVEIHPSTVPPCRPVVTWGSYAILRELELILPATPDEVDTDTSVVVTNVRPHGGRVFVHRNGGYCRRRWTLGGE